MTTNLSAINKCRFGQKINYLKCSKKNTILKWGTWGKLTVLKGKLKFYELTENGDVIAEHIFTPESNIPFVEPQAWHRVEALF